MTEPFAPWNDLANRLLGAFDTRGTDASHDLSHIVRVWRNAVRIARDEPDCDMEVLLAATILHDCVPVEKNSPDRPFAARLSSARAREIVTPLGWNAARVDALAHAIEAHSFSGGLSPSTLEAKILWDADQLDAIGAIGIARCFHVGGHVGSALYDPGDPAATARGLNDQAWSLDHFPAKLFRLADGLLTAEGRRMAAARAALMRDFVAAFLAEVEGE